MLWQLREDWSDKNKTIMRYGPNDTWSGEPTDPIVKEYFTFDLTLIFVKYFY